MKHKQQTKKETTMALRRKVVGALYKSKDENKPNYIKVKGPLTLADGQTIRAESKAFQLRSLQTAQSAGKLKDETAQQIKERIEKIPDFVIAELVLLEEAK